MSDSKHPVHFWGQEGLSREYNATIWGLPNWPDPQLENRIPRDHRDSYIQAALNGIHWRIDLAADRIALTHFSTLKIPGGTGFLAATQVFPRGLEPSFNAPGQLQAQLDLAIRMLTSTQVYVRPTNIPESGDYTSFPALPAAAQGEPQVWVATQVDDAEKILFAMQRLVHLRQSNLTVFLSPNAAGHPQHSLFGISRQLSFKEIEDEVENDKRAYAQEQARIAQQKREAEERIEQERQAEALRINRVEFENAGYGRQRGQKKQRLLYGILAALFVGLVLAGVLLFLREDTPDIAADNPAVSSPPSLPPVYGCANPKALNFNPRATEDQPHDCDHYQEIITIPESHKGMYTHEVHWLEHRTQGQEFKLQFASRNALAPQEVKAIKDSISEVNTKHPGIIQLNCTGNWDSLLISLRFTNDPLGRDRINIPLPPYTDLPTQQIVLTINPDDLDRDNDGFPASQDDYPFWGGKCDGEDFDGDGVDDQIDLDDDGDNVLDERDNQKKCPSQGQVVDMNGVIQVPRRTAPPTVRENIPPPAPATNPEPEQPAPANDDQSPGSDSNEQGTTSPVTNSEQSTDPAGGNVIVPDQGADTTQSVTPTPITIPAVNPDSTGVDSHDTDQGAGTTSTDQSSTETIPAHPTDNTPASGGLPTTPHEAPENASTPGGEAPEREKRKNKKNKTEKNDEDSSDGSRDTSLLHFGHYLQNSTLT